MVYEPSPWMILPFALLLAAIALGPLWIPNWWCKHYAKVSFVLAALTLGYYLFFLPAPARHDLLDVGHEYISFIALIGSLFVVSGGIHITVKGEATPHVNTIFLGIGAVLANVFGTTGASMLLIRPWLRMNRYRVTAHHVVFFIFVVSNVGGCLTPIGDPPLFLGYLRGVPFWWVFEHCWPMWLVSVAFLLIAFYIIDRRNYLRAPKGVREELAEPPDKWKFEGVGNIFFLGVILLAVFIQKPVFLREALMLGAALGSWFTTRKSIHQANHFSFHPIQEVAILFVGIFATMMPALHWLENHAESLLGSQPSSSLFYWGTGSLSAVLDNAPTYLSFLSAIFGAFVKPEVIAQVQQALAGTFDGSLSEAVRHTIEALNNYFPRQVAAGQVTPGMIEMAFVLGNLSLHLVAISVGAVFFGACTYIGNGPNFLVKSIAEHQKIHCPDFLGYVFKWTFSVLLPMLVLVWLIFFKAW